MPGYFLTINTQRMIIGLTVASFILLSLPRPAAAQTEPSYGLNFYRLQCITETGKTRLGSDEPYVLILTADLSTGEIKGRVTQVFSDVDSGESRNHTIRLWPLQHGRTKLSNMIFLVAILENDRDHTDYNVSLKAVTYVRKDLLTYVKVGHTRQKIGELMRADMKAGIEAARKGDTLIAEPQEVRISLADLQQASSGRSLNKTIEGRGGQSHYLAHFELMRY
jgi:hypothetical protein